MTDPQAPASPLPFHPSAPPHLDDPYAFPVEARRCAPVLARGSAHLRVERGGA